MRFPLAILLLALLTAASWASPGSVRFRGQLFQPRSETIQGKTYYRFDDPEIQKLISMTSAQVQWSSSGQTLYVFAPGRQTGWTNGASTYTVNGEETKAPGQMLTSPQAMEPAALWNALGLKAFPQGQETVLLPTITAVAVDGLQVHLKSGAAVKYESSEIEPGTLRVAIPDTAWDLPERRFRKSELMFEVHGGEKPGSTLMIDVRPWPHWGVRVNKGLSGDLTFTAEAHHLQGRGFEPVHVQQIKSQQTGEVQDLVISLDKPLAYYWSVTPEGELQLDLPLAILPAALQTNGWKQLNNDLYPIARYVGRLAPGQNFTLEEINQPHQLVLRRGPIRQVQATAESGHAQMAGYLVARGTVVIDPGHGGSDPGCRNRSLGVYEKDVTLDICFRLRSILEAQGWKVVMTREDDRDLTWPGSPDVMELEARSGVANKLGADVFVSIHCNASVSSVHRGTSIHWYKDSDYPLAQCLDVLGPSVGFQEKGLIQNRFVVLRHAQMPAALVETAYLTNPTEGAMLADPNVRQRIAEQLAGGLNNYMQSRTPQAMGK